MPEEESFEDALAAIRTEMAAREEKPPPKKAPAPLPKAPPPKEDLELITIEPVEKVVLAPEEYHNLKFKEFQEIFGKRLPDDEFRDVWAHYKGNRTKIPESLVPVIDQIKQEEQTLISKLIQASPEHADDINENRKKIIELSRKVPSFPSGLVFSIDELEFEKDEKGKPYIPSLSNVAYMGMIANDCDFEIIQFLQKLGLYRDLENFSKQYSGAGMSGATGYKGNLQFIRDVFNLPEPDRCEIYQFSIDSIKEHLGNMNDTEFQEYLRTLQFEKQFDNWLTEQLPEDFPKNVTVEEWYGYARKVFGIQPDFTMASKEEKIKQEALENIDEAVAILSYIKPGYDPGDVNLKKAYVTDHENEEEIQTEIQYSE